MKASSRRDFLKGLGVAVDGCQWRICGIVWMPEEVVIGGVRSVVQVGESVDGRCVAIQHVHI